MVNNCKQFTEEEYQKVKKVAKTNPDFKSLLAVMTHMRKKR